MPSKFRMRSRILSPHVVVTRLLHFGPTAEEKMNQHKKAKRDFQGKETPANTETETSDQEPEEFFDEILSGMFKASKTAISVAKQQKLDSFIAGFKSFASHMSDISTEQNALLEKQVDATNRKINAVVNEAQLDLKKEREEMEKIDQRVNTTIDNAFNSIQQISKDLFDEINTTISERKLQQEAFQTELDYKVKSLRNHISKEVMLPQLRNVLKTLQNE